MTVSQLHSKFDLVPRQGVALKSFSSKMRGVGSVALHADNKESMAMEVERVGDIKGKALIDKEELNHIAQAHADDVETLAEVPPATVLLQEPG